MTQEMIDGAAQYLTFQLDEEVFAVDIGQVREVVDFTRLTRVPRMPEFLRGVINLRGNVVPVVDLRLKFDMGRTEPTVDTCIVIVEIELDGEQNVLGALADAVHEVVEVDPSTIEPPPRIGARVRSDFIRGMGRRDGGFLILLDLDRVFSDDELAVVRQAERLAPAATSEEKEGTAAGDD